jgi:hypothetical protein
MQQIQAARFPLPPAEIDPGLRVSDFVEPHEKHRLSGQR